jgi:dihydroneopterin aldolase
MFRFLCKSPEEKSLIFIRDMVADMRIGVFDVEKKAPQKVRINIEVEPLIWPVNSDDIKDTVSYSGLLDAVRECLSGPHIHLVETVAEKIAGECLSRFKIRKIKVRVEKLEIFSFATPGVEIVRVRKP